MTATTQPGIPQVGVRSLPGVTVIDAGVAVQADGSLIGISGAPLEANDEACAEAGVAAIRD